MVDGTFAAISNTKVSGEEILLSGIGKSRIEARAARERRIPLTGATIMIAAANELSIGLAQADRDCLCG